MGHFVAHHFAGAVEAFDADVVVAAWVVVGVKFDVNFAVIGAAAVLQGEDHFFSGGGSVFLIEGLIVNGVPAFIHNNNSECVVAIWVINVWNIGFAKGKFIVATTKIFREYRFR